MRSGLSGSDSLEVVWHKAVRRVAMQVFFWSDALESVRCSQGHGVLKGMSGFPQDLITAWHFCLNGP